MFDVIYITYCSLILIENLGPAVAFSIPENIGNPFFDNSFVYFQTGSHHFNHLDCYDGDKDFALKFMRNEAQLLPFLYLIADRVYEIFPPNKPESGHIKTIIYDDYREVLGSWVEWQMGRTWGDQYVKVMSEIISNPKNIVFGPCTNFKKKMFQKHGLSSRNAALLLAAAGIEIVLPNISLDVSRKDELFKIREKLEEERLNYVLAVTKYADDAFERLVHNVYGDTVEWAINEAFFKILPKAKEYENALKKLDKKLLQRIGVGYFREGLPAIASTFSEKGFVPGATKAVTELLKVLCKSLKSEEHKWPEAIYTIKLSRELGKINK